MSLKRIKARSRTADEIADERQSQGLRLTEIARRSGIDLASLSRLESGKNPNRTFETLSRYTAAPGLRLNLWLQDLEELASAPSVPE